MYLKRLEIMGFKSFADKIRLDFTPGVTGVVGPNGSGKSNISDALRWVLGEQSVKNLRGSRMDDVIFIGSEFRKPLGLAEVTIVLDNSDRSVPLEFSEISVTRKLFRSGESEYLINKSPVRLKDVLDLFHDTGLGKEAYSVIGQGKIDAILSAKAEERRYIFEEAAGIIKYKTRKQVAERKLEDTDRNLLRLHDILNELRTQLGPLEAQAALAQQYLALKEELSRVEINYYGVQVQATRETIEELHRNKSQLGIEYQDFEGQESLIEAALEERRIRLLDQDKQIGEWHEEFFRIQNQIDKLKEQSNFLQTRLHDLNHKDEEYQQQQTENSQRKERLTGEQRKLGEEIAGVGERLNNLVEEIRNTEAMLGERNQELVELETAENKYQSQNLAAMNELSGLKNRLNSTTLQKEFAMQQAAEFEKKREFLKQQLAKLSEEDETKRQIAVTVDDEIGNSRHHQAELAQKIIAREEEIVSVENKNLEWKEKIRGLESKINLLDEMERSFQGYFQGVKAVLAETTSQPFHQHIRGIVADLIKVQPGMELALETALGSSLQHIVIDHDQAAQEAIAFLKKYNKGRATFLPLNMIQAHDRLTPHHQQILQQHSCQLAISLLQFAPEYRTVLSYLLHQTVVAPDLKTAVKVGTKLDKSFRIVTPEGDLVNPGGSITGGSIDKRRLGLLTRRREIEDFKTEKNEAENFLAKGLQNAKAMRAVLQELAADLENTKKKEHEAQLKKIALERELDTIRQNRARFEEEHSLCHLQLEQLAEANVKFDLDHEELEQSITAKEQELSACERSIMEIVTRKQELSQSKENVFHRLTELKSELSAGNQELAGKTTLQEQFFREGQELDRFDGDLVQKKEQLGLERARILDAMKESEQKTIDEETRLGTQEKLVNRGKQSKEQIQFEIKELENRGRSFRKKSNEYQQQFHRLELLINQKTLELENINSNLREYYGENWGERVEPGWTDPGDTLSRIERVKIEIRDLGVVNLAAVDDYKQISQRYEFLSEQANDLEKARESLLKVIHEIERTIVKRFMETFEQVKVEFKKLFGELFEGGNADLSLLEPENPLTSGVEITAQPPGKKLQTLSLLSGGERAMTAIALLFAILAVKPSPFCVFDEIDAPLDEANVHRFARCLELFSKDLQFIVVTHRRGTMEVANALYGVTMEEKGVSKLISLDLNEKAG